MDFGQIHLHVRVLCGPKTGRGPTFCGEMDELASKLFKTFFRSKKSFLSSENELVEVISKMNILGDFHAPKSPNPMILCESLCKPVVKQSSFFKNSNFFVLIN